MADLFVSYSRTDARFVEKVAGQLRAAGISVWVDTEGIGGGDAWRTAITQAVNECRWCMLVVSPRSMASPQVAREVNMVFDKGRPIVPVVYEPSELNADLQYALAGLQHVDFTAATFDDAMSGLRQALGAAGPARSLRSTVLSEDEVDASTVGRGPAFPLRIDVRGGIGLASSGDAIDGALRMIILTAPGERLGRPDFGCTAGELVFERPDRATVAEMEQRVIDALTRWEPRARDLSVHIVPSRWKGQFDVAITYSVRGSSERRECRCVLAPT